jgi:hypothetical protein
VGDAPVGGADQTAIDTADAAAGYRDVLDDETIDQLPADDPNVACAHGNYDHLNHVGDPVDDDGGVAAALAKLDVDTAGH